MSKIVWPTQAEASAFYGSPAAANFSAHHLTQVACPWRICIGKVPVSHITINRACAASLERALASIWAALKKSDKAAAAHGYDQFSGSFNYRPIRGGANLSMHAYGAAIDWDAPENAMGPTVGRFKDDDLLVEAFKAEGWIWGGDWCGRKDGMHVQAARVR